MNRYRYEQIWEYCKEKQLLQAGDGIVIGLSGGADSVYLLLFLVWLREQWNLKLCAVHLNHKIRGTAADEDERFSKELAEAHRVTFRSFQKDVRDWAKRQGMSEEEAGREWRYQCFRQVKEELNFQWIAVAHHRDDQAETVLMQMLRGSGLQGLGGMRPRKGDLIRPLLCLSRKEIEADLSEEGVAWREDQSNQETMYQRNKLRHQVIPYLEREIQPEAAGHLAATAEQMQEVWTYLDRQIQSAYQDLVRVEEHGSERSGKRFSFARKDFLALDSVLQSYLLLEILAAAAGRRKDLGRVHVKNLQGLVTGETGKRISLPYGLRAGRDYGRIWIDAAADPGSGLTAVQGEAETLPVRWERRRRESLPEGIPKNNCTKWFDYDKIKSAPKWRHPQNGDFIGIDRAGHRKKVSRMLLDAKIPRERRAALWILADGNHVLWIPALDRISMGCYVTEETEEVCIVNLYQIMDEEKNKQREKGGAS